MEKEFVPYQLAVKLKELGFNETCFGYYSEGELIHSSHTNIHMQRFRYAAPTYSQAFKWFREKGYDVKVQKESDGLYFGFYWTGAAWIIVGNGTYEEAELACLDKLIEIVESKSE